jgi:hypothetical protein
MSIRIDPRTGNIISTNPLLNPSITRSPGPVRSLQPVTPGVSFGSVNFNERAAIDDRPNSGLISIPPTRPPVSVPPASPGTTTTVRPPIINTPSSGSRPPSVTNQLQPPNTSSSSNPYTPFTPNLTNYNGPTIDGFRSLFGGTGTRGTTGRNFQGPGKDTSPITSIDIGTILKGNAGIQHVINGHGYEFELYIVNSTGRVLPIAPTAVKNLTLNDSLASWFTSGSLTISYDNEWGEQLNKFLFRNDGEDFIRFRLLPLNDNRYGTLKITKEIWELNCLFSISDVHDVSPKTKSNTDASVVTKFKKFFFKDIREHFLRTQNIEYSTAYSSEAPISKLPLDFQGRYLDANRSIFTGICIDEIIKQTFNYDPILSKTGRDVNKNNNWDDGAAPIFFTSGADETSYDALTYVMNHHTSENITDFSILHIEREENGIGFFGLKPLSRIFAKAGNKANEPGPYQLEHFFLRNDFNLKDKNKPSSVPRAPLLTNKGVPSNDLKKDIKINDFNIIDKYEFVDMSPAINSLLMTTKPIYSFDFNQRRFNIEFEEHSIDFAQKIFNENYIKNLYKGKGGNNFLTPNITPTKIKNRNIFPSYSPYGDDPITRLPDGLQKILQTGLFQNTCINFTVPGLTFRTPGKFIGIDRISGSSGDNQIDDKLCGQWFVIDVKHILAVGIYYNSITAVKIHSHNPNPLT